MTDSEHRIGKLEEKTQSLELRQVSYEEFTKANIAIMREQIEQTKERMDRMETQMTERMNRMDERMDRLDAKVDNVSTQMHNLTIAATVGIAAIVITIILK